MKRKLFTLTALALAVCSVALAGQPQGGAAAPAQPEYHLVPNGTVAPDFTALTPKGKAVHLKDYRGKIVILDFWATWCGPCQVSMPGLEKVYQQVKNQNVVVLSLNTWDKESDFKAWVEENSGSKYNFTFVRDPAEGDHDAIRKTSIAKTLYSVPGIPTMYVIDKEGKIAGSFVGSGNEKNLVGILKKLGLKATVPSDGK